MNEKDMGIQQQLFQAVDTIVGTRLEGLAYDKTVSCIIEDDSNRKTGKYIVSDGSVKFVAYADVTTYVKGTNVLVTIPNGDYTRRKIIIGKDTGDNDAYAVDNRAFQITEDSRLSLFAKEKSGLIANGDTLMESIELTQPFNGSDAKQQVLKSALLGLTRLKVSVKFRTDLKDVTVKSGNYGVRIYLWIDNEKTQLWRSLTFETKDVFGLPYNLQGFEPQEKLFDITGIPIISKITVDFFQDNDFIDQQGNRIPVLAENLSNLSLNELRIDFGYSAEETLGDRIDLYDQNNISTYADGKFTNGTDSTSLQVRWTLATEDGATILTGTDMPKGYRLDWYKYVGTATTADLNSNKSLIDPGEGWQLIPQAEVAPVLSKTIILSPEEAKQSEVVYLVIGYKEEKVTVNAPEGSTTEIIYKNIQRASYSYKDTSDREVEYPPSDSLFAIGCLSDFKGNYFIYDHETRRQNEVLGVEQLTLLKVGSDVLTDPSISNVVWTYPDPQSSMIVREEGLKDNEYKIRTIYDPALTNNTITCNFTVTMENGQQQDYIVYLLLTFGYKNFYEGTPNRFFIRPGENAKPYFSSRSGWNDQVFNVYLNDEQFNNLLANSDVTVEWSIIGSGKNNFIISKSDKYAATLSYQGGDIMSPAYLKTVAKLGLVAEEPTTIPTTMMLVAYYPLAFTNVSDRTLPLIKGPTYINYASDGRPRYNSQDVYGQILSADNDFELVGDDASAAGLSLNISIYEKKSQARLIAQPNTQPYVKEDPPDVGVKITQSVPKEYFIQSILSIQDRFDYSILSNWDGKDFGIGENGIVKSSMLIAGRREEPTEEGGARGGFSGFMIGDLSYSENTNETGIYGFAHGVRTFALGELGAAKFGAAGKGQIVIDGTSGVLYSAGPSMDSSNNDAFFKIDLSNSRIYSKELLIDGNPILDLPNEEKLDEAPWFEIGGTNRDKIYRGGSFGLYKIRKPDNTSAPDEVLGRFVLNSGSLKNLKDLDAENINMNIDNNEVSKILIRSQILGNEECYFYAGRKGNSFSIRKKEMLSEDGSTVIDDPTDTRLVFNTENIVIDSDHIIRNEPPSPTNPELWEVPVEKPEGSTDPRIARTFVDSQGQEVLGFYDQEDEIDGDYLLEPAVNTDGDFLFLEKVSSAQRFSGQKTYTANLWAENNEVTNNITFLLNNLDANDPKRGGQSFYFVDKFKFGITEYVYNKSYKVEKEICVFCGFALDTNKVRELPTNQGNIKCYPVLVVNNNEHKVYRDSSGDFLYLGILMGEEVKPSISGQLMGLENISSNSNENCRRLCVLNKEGYVVYPGLNSKYWYYYKDSDGKKLKGSFLYGEQAPIQSGINKIITPFFRLGSFGENYLTYDRNKNFTFQLQDSNLNTRIYLASQITPPIDANKVAWKRSYAYFGNRKKEGHFLAQSFSFDQVDWPSNDGAPRVRFRLDSPLVAFNTQPRHGFKYDAPGKDDSENSRWDKGKYTQGVETFGLREMVDAKDPHVSLDSGCLQYKLQGVWNESNKVWKTRYGLHIRNAYFRAEDYPADFFGTSDQSVVSIGETGKKLMYLADSKGTGLKIDTPYFGLTCINRKTAAARVIRIGVENDDSRGYIYYHNTSGLTVHAKGAKVNSLEVQDALSINSTDIRPYIQEVTSGSSIRFKRNIQYGIDTSILAKMTPVTFQYKEDKKFNSQNIRKGYLAEELDMIDPNLVEHDEKGQPYAVDYNSIITMAVEEIKQLRREINELKEKNK